MIPTYSLLPESWRDLARALVAELVGTMFLVLIGCGAAVNWKTNFDVTQVVWLGRWSIICKMSQKVNVFGNLSFSSGVICFWTGCHGHRQLHWACQWRQVLFRFLIFEIHANFIYAASSGIFSAPFSQFKLIVVLVSCHNFLFYFFLHATQQCDM